jgi:hypothetical protein
VGREGCFLGPRPYPIRVRQIKKTGLRIAASHRHGPGNSFTTSTVCTRARIHYDGCDGIGHPQTMRVVTAAPQCRTAWPFGFRAHLLPANPGPARRTRHAFALAWLVLRFESGYRAIGKRAKRWETKDRRSLHPMLFRAGASADMCPKSASAVSRNQHGNGNLNDVG